MMKKVRVHCFTKRGKFKIWFWMKEGTTKEETLKLARDESLRLNKENHYYASEKIGLVKIGNVYFKV